MSLRRNYLSGLESVAQTVGVLAPAGTIGVILPLLIGKTGNGTWLMFLAVAGIFLLIACNIAVFARRHASAGGLASFVRLGLGPRWGVAAGWVYVGAMLFGAASAAPAAAYYGALFIARLTGLPNTPLLNVVVNDAVVAAAWWTAYRDIKLSSDVMIVVESSSLALMAAILLLAAAHSGTWIDRPQLTLQGAGLPGFSAGLVLAFLTMGGFESAATLGEESRHAETTIPRIILGTVLPVAVLYLAATYLLVGLGRKFGLSLDQLDAPFDTLARADGAPVLGLVSSLGIAMSFLACTLGSINAGARTLYSLAQEGAFFASFGRTHPANRTPHRGIALLAVVAIAAPTLLLFADMPTVSVVDNLSQLAALGYIGSYFLVCLAAPFYLASQGRLRWGGLAVAVAALLLLGLVMGQSVFPVPPAPARYLPYVFLGTVAAGFCISRALERRRWAGKAA
ncbi:MAG TPA: APC family permease [Opitutaceae bacterium]|nr:APC family permease [Opitutaceae bacterium]